VPFQKQVLAGPWQVDAGTRCVVDRDGEGQSFEESRQESGTDSLSELRKILGYSQF